MSDFLLTVWAKDDPNSQGSPISLWQLDGDSNAIEPPIAAHSVGLENSPIDFTAFQMGNGNPFTIETVLTREGLTNSGLLRHVGKELWKRLAVGALKSELERLVNQDCCVYLELKSTELERLPWELLSFDELPLFALEESRWLIGSPSPTNAANPGELADTAIPMRIMIVIGNLPDDDKLLADDELATIERLAHDKNADVLLKVSSCPTFKDLQETLTTFRPHVFHFIGHGADDGVDAVLHVWTKIQNDTMNASRIRQVFRKSPPRLVVLNACSTATTTTTRPLADAFLAAGCPAVLAMRGEILSNSSVQLSGSIYKEIFAGKSIDKATAAARHELKNLGQAIPPQSQEELRSNWPLPRLKVNGKVAEVLKITMTVPRLPEDHKPCIDFVDRWNHRWQTLQTIDPQCSRLLVLYGPQDSGKSELLKTLAAISSQQGCQVLVVNRTGRGSGTWQELLGFVMEEAAALGYDISSLKETYVNNQTSDKAIPEFLKALDALVEEKLVLVVDGLKEWEPKTLNDCVLPLFCKPFLSPDVHSKIRLMIALREKPDNKVWGVLPARWEPIEVGDFKKSDDESNRAIKQIEMFWKRAIGEATNNNAEVLQNFTDYVKTTAKYVVSTKILELIRLFAKVLIQQASH